jgi:lipoprotein-anchoring transpeptidase ErfK/SrfK
MLHAPYLNRRFFLGTALAATAFPVLAEDMPKGWTLPDAQRPTRMRLQNDFAPGQIIVDPNTFSLYWTEEKSMAVRFIVGVGRGDLYEPGTFRIGAKKEWPSWTPTKEMIARNPKSYARWKDGMPGGPQNPLGARALYLFDNQRGDTFLRIHGTPQPWTIASAVSNGCVRLVNEHIAYLYDQVPMDAPVSLYPKRKAV